MAPIGEFFFYFCGAIAPSKEYFYPLPTCGPAGAAPAPRSVMSLSPSRRTVLTMAAALAAPALRTLPALAQATRARVGVIPIIGSSPICVAD
jgi:hypothetical protein